MPEEQTKEPTPAAEDESAEQEPESESTELLVSEETVEEEPAQLNASNASIVASGTCGADGDNLTWTLDEVGTLTITGTGSMDDYPYGSAAPWYANKASIRNIVVEFGATSIGDFAFYSYGNLLSIVLADSVANIGEQAFDSCVNMSEVTISNGLKTIENSAFNNCSSISNIEIPNGTESIGNSAFSFCSSLKSVTVPQSVSSLGEYVFQGCSELESAEILGSIASLGSQTFGSCIKLETVSLPDTIISIGWCAFTSCKKLASIVIPAKVGSIASSAFNSCSNLKDVYYAKTCRDWNGISIGDNNDCLTSATIHYGQFFIDYYNGTELLETQTKNSGEAITLSNNVPTKAGFQFLGWADSEDATVAQYQSGNSYTADADITLYAVWEDIIASGDCGDNLTWTLDSKGLLTISGTGEMSDYSNEGAPWYSNRSSIKNAKIKSGVTRIGNYAFSDCSSLTSIEIPSSVTSIGNYCFDGCSSLNSISLPSSLQTVESYAFKDCYALTNVVIPDSVITIGYATFNGCKGLKSMTIPFLGNDLTNIDSAYNTLFGRIFGSCSSGTEGMTSVGQFYQGSSNPYTPNTFKYVTYSFPTSLTKVTITGGEVYDYAFFGCSMLTDITLPTTATYIGKHALESTGIKTITIPSSVKTIKYEAFARSKLTTVTVPGTVETIDGYAFYQCRQLKEATIKCGVASIGEKAFYYCDALESVGIPETMKSIGEDAFEGCSAVTEVNYITADYDGHVREWAHIIFADAEANPLQSGKAYLYHNGIELTHFSVTGGAEYLSDSYYQNVSNFAFYKCQNDMEVVANGGYQGSIGNYAFYGSNITALDFASGVKSIGDYACYNCKNLNYFYRLFESVETIGEGAFYNSGIESFSSDTITSIGSDAFGNCSKLSEINFYGSAPTIGYGAFSGVTADVTYICNGEYDATQNYGGTLTWKIKHTEVTDAGYAATCLETGLTSGRHCSACNEVFVAQEEIPALGHDMVTTTVDPTCSAAGYDNHQCSRCEYNYRDNEVAKLSHKWQTKVVDPTCTEEGYTYRECSLCGTTTPHTNKTAALGHSFTDYVSNSDATCTQDGTKTAHCDHGCGATDTVADEGTASGHTYGEWTDKGDGTHIRTCGDCSDVETESHHFEETSRENETCTQTGLITYTCKDCGAVTTEVIPVHDHTLEVWTYSGSDTRTHYSVCTECEETFTEACVFTDTVIQPTCRSQGYTNHVCNICGYSYKTDFTTKLDHTFKHLEAKEPTCTVDGNEDCYICEECGTYFWSDDESLYCEPEDVIIPAKGHSYGEAVFTWAEDGKSATAECVCENDDSHILSGDADITSSVKAPATCESTGTTTYTATVILDGKQYTDTKDVEDIPVLNHDLIHHDAKTPTPSEEGNIEYWECSGCGKLFKDENCTKELSAEDVVIPKTKYGDVTLDGNINIQDVYLLRKAAVGLVELTDGQKTVADIYTDGRYNSLDVNLLRRYLAKIVEQIPYEPQQ